jgi:hypothetical protein
MGFVLHIAELGVGVVGGQGVRALERLFGELVRVDSFHSSA